jgi:hypothetical protein
VSVVNQAAGHAGFLLTVSATVCDSPCSDSICVMLVPPVLLAFPSVEVHFTKHASDTAITQNIMDKWLALLHVWEVPDSNHGLEVSYSALWFIWFYSVPKTCRDNALN